MAFVVMAGLGLDAKMIANTNPELKKRVGWLAYVDAIVRSMRDSEKLRVRYSVDGGDERSMSVHTVLVGNCGTLPGNVLLLPEAAIDDGVFDIVALRPEGFFGWAQIWIKIFWENGVLRRSSVGRKLVAGLGREVRTLRYIKAATITARLDRAEDFELDGDDFGEAIAFRAHVEAGGAGRAGPGRPRGRRPGGGRRGRRGSSRCGRLTTASHDAGRRSQRHASTARSATMPPAPRPAAAGPWRRTT